MAVDVQNAIYRSPRRVRVLFSNTLAAGAFVNAFYTVQSTDDLGAVPDVMAALIVGDSPNVVELALSVDLASGAGYTVTVAAGVPAADASTTPTERALPVRAPGEPAAAAERRVLTEALDRLYGVDLVFDGTDFVENAAGDLQTIRGIPNVEAALERRALSEGLKWAPDYGAKPRQHVDGPAASIGVFKADLVRQLQADDRVKRATVRQSAVGVNLSEAIFESDVELVGGAHILRNTAVRSS